MNHSMLIKLKTYINAEILGKLQNVKIGTRRNKLEYKPSGLRLPLPAAFPDDLRSLRFLLMAIRLFSRTTSN